MFVCTVCCYGSLIDIERHVSLSDNSSIRLSNGNDAVLVDDSVVIDSKGQVGKYTGRGARLSFVRPKWSIFILIRLVQGQIILSNI